MQGHSNSLERSRTGKPKQTAQASAQHPPPRRLVSDAHGCAEAQLGTKKHPSMDPRWGTGRAPHIRHIHPASGCAHTHACTHTCTRAHTRVFPTATQPFFRSAVAAVHVGTKGKVWALGCQRILGEVQQPPAAEDELSTSRAERASTFCEPWKPGWRLLPFSSGSFSASNDLHSVPRPLSPWVLPSVRGFVAMPCVAPVDLVRISWILELQRLLNFGSVIPKGAEALGPYKPQLGWITAERRHRPPLPPEHPPPGLGAPSDPDVNSAAQVSPSLNMYSKEIPAQTPPGKALRLCSCGLSTQDL